MEVAPRVAEPEAISPSEVLLRTEIVEPSRKQLPEPPQENQRPESETFADRLADLAEHLHAEPVPYSAPQVVAREATPSSQPEQRPRIIDLAPARPLLAPPPTVRLLAEPQPPAVARLIPAKHLFQPQPPVDGSLRRGELSAAGTPPGVIQVPKAPGGTASPGLADLLDYREAAESQMRIPDCPVQPSTRLVDPKSSLPGPSLPRELTSLQAAGLVPIRTVGAENTSTNQYGWVARMAVLAIFLTAGLAAAYRVMPSSAPASAPPKAVPQAVAEEPAPPRPANSLARLVEVTGFRFLEVNKKPQIQYLVVNHSSAPLASMTVYVTLRAAHPKAGQPPLARLTFQSPRLSAFEAKEMASPIERVLGPLELPDWQDLRADVDVQ